MIETSRQMAQAIDRLRPFMDWATTPPISDVAERREACDFLFGNPHDVAPEGYLAAVRSGIEPRGPGHYAYAWNEKHAAETVAASLRDRFGLPFTAGDVVMTNGNFTGLGVLLRVLTNPGDEVIFVSPPWFFYETLIVAAGATPIRVIADRNTFDLDLGAIEHAITEQTRAVIINSPNNPSGRVYRRADLDALGGLLSDASDRIGRPIHLLSDEAYSRILFDGIEFATPVASYPYSYLIYTYGKAHLAPGNRLGYIALSPSMPDRGSLLDPLMLGVISGGWSFPVAPLQHAIAELDAWTTDISALQRRRDVVVHALREQGYELVVPEGTFYVLVRSPEPDDEAFSRRLVEHDVYVLPGAMFEMPGWFRISLTASDDMVDRGIPGFAKAIAEVRG